MNFKLRVTGILIEDERILLVKQRLNDARNWSLPGGTLETGETLEECMIREMREETGLLVAIEKLLYVCDRISENRHVVHITFKLRRTGGNLQLGSEPEPFANPISAVTWVPVAELTQYGFSKCFRELVQADFPNSGQYMGGIGKIGL